MFFSLFLCFLHTIEAKLVVTASAPEGLLLNLCGCPALGSGGRSMLCAVQLSLCTRSRVVDGPPPPALAARHGVRHGTVYRACTSQRVSSNMLRTPLVLETTAFRTPSAVGICGPRVEVEVSFLCHTVRGGVRGIVRDTAVINASGPRAAVRSDRLDCTCGRAVYTVLPSVRTS